VTTAKPNRLFGPSDLPRPSNGKATIESDKAVGGTIIEMDLRRRAGEYRIDYLGLATFAE